MEEALSCVGNERISWISLKDVNVFIDFQAQLIWKVFLQLRTYRGSILGHNDVWINFHDSCFYIYLTWKSIAFWCRVRLATLPKTTSFHSSWLIQWQYLPFAMVLASGPLLWSQQQHGEFNQQRHTWTFGTKDFLAIERWHIIGMPICEPILETCAW